MSVDPVDSGLGAAIVAHQALYEGAQGPGDPDHTRTRKWLGWAVAQIYPDRPKAAEDPVSDLLLRPFHEIEESLTLWFNANVAGGSADQAALACCLVRSAAELAGRDATDAASEVVDLAAVRRYLRVLRQLVWMLRGDRSELAASVSLALAQDISALLFGALEVALVAPAVSGLLTLEKIVDDVLDKGYDAVARTRCLPLIQLLNLVVGWMWEFPMGFVRRIRSFVLGTVIRSRRQFTEMYAHHAIGGEGSLRISEEQARILLVVLDALIEAADIFGRCPLPRRPDTGSDGEGDRDGEGGGRDGGDGDAGTPGTGTPDTGGPGTGGPGTGGPGTGGPGTDGPDTPGTGGPTRPAREDDPHGEDTGWMTPANLARVLTSSFGVAPAEAARLANARSCAGDLSPAATAALARLGIQP